MLLMPEESSSSKNVRNGYYATATPEVPGIAMPDKTAKKTLAGALAALGEGQFAMSEASVHVSLVFERNFDMPHAANFLPFKTASGTAMVESYVSAMVAAAKDNGAALFLHRTQTWRANPDWAERVGVGEGQLEKLTRIAAKESIKMRDRHWGDRGYVTGTVGPRGDAYAFDASAAMTPDEAEEYHSRQIGIMADEGVDTISAYTLTYPDEAVGIVRAAARAGKGAIVGFTLEKDGKLVCGASLEEAVKAVDKATKDQGKPLFYAINCTHVSDILPLFVDKEREPWMERLVEVMANPSTKSHAELDAATELDAGDPAEFAQLYVRLRRARPSFRIFGGCCGSNDEHMRQVALALGKHK